MKSMVIFFVVVVLLCGAGYFYHVDTQARIQQLTENNAKLESANRINTETIGQLQRESQRLQEANKKLAQGMQDAESKVTEIRDKFIDHDLVKLSIKKPELIEKRINDGTKKAFDELRDLTK